MNTVIPILRIFDEDKARQFYFDFLGFQMDWEHRFEEEWPLYMQVSREGCVVHLSEHHGDSCPGAAIRIHVENIKVLHQELSSKDYKYSHPGLETTPWNTQEVTVTDPFGNKLIFWS